MLLDTNALLWMHMGNPRLSHAARRRIDQAPFIYFSPISILEIEIKRMKSGMPVPTNFYDDILKNGFVELKLSGKHALGIRSFQGLAGHDPFDRILLGAAETEGVPFMTADQKILELNLPFVLDAQE